MGIHGELTGLQNELAEAVYFVLLHLQMNRVKMMFTHSFFCFNGMVWNGQLHHFTEKHVENQLIEAATDGGNCNAEISQRDCNIHISIEGNPQYNGDKIEKLFNVVANQVDAVADAR